MDTSLQVDHGDGSATTNQDTGLRRGPWTVEEDVLLANYIAINGEGRWNFLARTAGLRRTGKSCRLRWLNYLRPDVRRGNLTAEEQLLILELHSRWGNRWSKIAQHLPGRTDNEIKNYWRTRVQKHAKHLQLDVNSTQFRDLMRYLWMPRLVERIHASSSPSSESVGATSDMPSLVDSSQEICGWSSTDDSSMSESMLAHATPEERMLQQSRIASEFANWPSFEGVGPEWNGGVSSATVEEPWASGDGHMEQAFPSIDGGEMAAESFWSMDCHELWSLQGFHDGISNFVNY